MSNEVLADGGADQRRTLIRSHTISLGVAQTESEICGMRSRSMSFRIARIPNRSCDVQLNQRGVHGSNRLAYVANNPSRMARIAWLFVRLMWVQTLRSRGDRD